MSPHRLTHSARFLSALVFIPATFPGVFTPMRAIPCIVFAILSVPLMGQLPDYVWTGMKTKRDADTAAEITRKSRGAAAQPRNESTLAIRDGAAESTQSGKQSQLGDITLLVTGKYSNMSAAVIPDPAAAQLGRIFNSSYVPTSLLLLDDGVVFRALSTNVRAGGGCNHSREHKSAAMWAAPDSDVIGWGEREARSIVGAAGTTILVTDYDLSKRPGKMIFMSKCDQNVLVYLQFIRPVGGANEREVIVPMLEAVRVAR